jgi:hypothetical protein
MPSKEEKEIDAVYQHAKLCSWKYRKVDLALTETVKSHGASGLRILPDSKFNPIFLKQVKEGDPLVMDQKREQCLDLVEHVKGTWLKKTFDHLQEELDVIYPDLVICYASALKSKPGGAMESYHADFSRFDYVRFAGIISFDALTTLEVQISPRNKRTVHLGAGEAIIFRGDLFHAGSTYAKENRRIYFKAIPRGCVLGQEEHDAVALGYVCDVKKGGCGKRHNFLKELHNHCQNCDVWQEGQKKRKK